MWIYDPDRMCKECFGFDTCFYGVIKNNKIEIHNICFLCKREKRNISNKKNYPKHKNKIIARNKKWIANNYKRYIEGRRKNEISKILENMYLTERI